MSFASLALHPKLIQALPANVEAPTDIQTLAIPELLNQRDLLALANTGSGKTLAYGLPLLHMLDQQKQQGQSATEPKQALILVPTRELAIQVNSALSSLAKALDITTLCVCGGIDKLEQQQALEKQPEVIVATTGRLLDLVGDGSLTLAQVDYLVLDEADRLLDMGFWADVQTIVSQVNPQRQTAMFSATFSEALKLKASEIQVDPKQVLAHAQNSVNEQVTEQLFLVNKGSKANALIALITQHKWSQVLVFIGAKENADKLTKKLTKAGILASALHGNKSQQEREQTLTDFKAGKITVLIATDLLARGVDIAQLPVVINVELPSHAEVYVHRVGRTARAGQHGVALSLVSHGEMGALNAIRQLTQRALPLHNLEGFPVTDTPSSGESKRAPRDKKANRRTNNKKSVKQFQGNTNRGN